MSHRPRIEIIIKPNSHPIINKCSICDKPHAYWYFDNTIFCDNCVIENSIHNPNNQYHRPNEKCLYCGYYDDTTIQNGFMFCSQYKQLFNLRYTTFNTIRNTH